MCYIVYAVGNWRGLPRGLTLGYTHHRETRTKLCRMYENKTTQGKQRGTRSRHHLDESSELEKTEQKKRQKRKKEKNTTTPIGEACAYTKPHPIRKPLALLVAGCGKFITPFTACSGTCPSARGKAERCEARGACADDLGLIRCLRCYGHFAKPVVHNVIGATHNP